METDCWSYDGIIYTLYMHRNTNQHIVMSPCLSYHHINKCLFKQKLVFMLWNYHSVMIVWSFILISPRGGSFLCSLTQLIRDSPQAVWGKMLGQSVILSPWALKCSALSRSPRTLASTVSDPLNCTWCTCKRVIKSGIPCVVLNQNDSHKVLYMA